jgi:hypothetical protein
MLDPTNHVKFPVRPIFSAVPAGNSALCNATGTEAQAIDSLGIFPGRLTAERAEIEIFPGYFP